MAEQSGDISKLASSLRDENPAGRYAEAAKKAMDVEEGAWKGAGGYRYAMDGEDRIRILNDNGEVKYAKRGTPAFDAIMREKASGDAAKDPVDAAPNLAAATGDAPPSGAPALTDTARASGVDLNKDVPPPITAPGGDEREWTELAGGGRVSVDPPSAPPEAPSTRSTLAEVVRKVLAQIEADEAEQSAAAGRPSPNDVGFTAPVAENDRFTSPASNMGPTI